MKKTKHIILSSIGLIGLLLLITAVAVMAEKPETRTLSRAVLKIDSLSCGGCFSTISSGFAPLKGYSGMGTNLFRKLIAIDFAEPLTIEKISSKLAQVGYPGKLKYVDNISQKESFAYIDAKKNRGSSNSGSCCSSGAIPDSRSIDPGSSGLAEPTSGGSCCTLPDVSQSTKAL
ncbi:heavy-metal-associated domain-containing protein [Desulfobacula toluolica]|uniref:Predicted heavy metal transport/detoxification protein n=1 Tax=Desulfobacula toluolica (strain DSM 7467 / Tol2) TaxID=651182 RepID=K0NPR0_DESTT|nr:heavy metal transport/detoxification protein [Desulfobacula toluolica]CCK82123.1 predicted heavy metal transport/detoxification protein [Desulfobacula toluolica Tol2]